ncbi:MAG: EamA family transporter, partial [Peptococcaceae bacterium]|nr:EamA family transporter [Peptococcaceae bacterium]
DKTIMQLGIAAVVLLPYTLLTENWSTLSFDTNTVVMLLIMGIVHTGFAYAMYFGTTRVLSAQTLALFSYIDPIVFTFGAFQKNTFVGDENAYRVFFIDAFVPGTFAKAKQTVTGSFLF